MSNEQFNDLSGRVDGVARVLMALIADLEIREAMNGDRFGEALRRLAVDRGQHARNEISAQVMVQIADELEAARANRSAVH